MIGYYLKLAYRNLLRHRGFTLLNLAGLGLGLACCILLAAVIWHELRYDQHHPQAERLYRVLTLNKNENSHYVGTSPLMAPALLADVPGVAAAARYVETKALISRPDKPSIRGYEHHFAWSDTPFLTVMPPVILRGDAEKALRDPKGMIVTERMARQFFGSEDPLGRTILVDNQWELQVLAIMADADPAQPSYLQPAALASFDAFQRSLGQAAWSSWWWPQVQTLVRLAPQTDVAAMNAEVLPAFIAKHREPEVAKFLVPQVQAVTKVHLQGANEGEGSGRFVYLLAVVGVFVLGIACINFMNLSTARALRRAREVGLNKTLGAQRWQVATQFLGESFLMGVAALAIALVLAEAALPLFRNLVQVPVQIPYATAAFWGLAVLLLGVVALGAGSYPALYLSSFAPGVVLQDRVRAGRGHLRRLLVVGQFGISILLIVGTLTIYRQLRYVQERDLGYDTDRVLVLETQGDLQVMNGLGAFRSRATALPGVKGVAAANWMPGENAGFQFPGTLDGKDMVPGILYVDREFFAQMKLELAHGRGFDPQLESDSTNFIVNLAAVREAQKDGAQLLGKPVRIGFGENGKTIYQKQGSVIGVAQDFHALDLHQPIGPTFITMADGPINYGYFFVKLGPGELSSQVEGLEAAWKELFPQRPFEPQFLDERIQHAYRAERQLALTVGIAAGLALGISCLGLIGLAAYALEARRKELSIRKVLGATTGQLTGLLLTEFVRLVAIAFVVAAPLAWYLMDQWLARFAYRTEVTVLSTLLAGGVALLIAISVVGVQALRAAQANPSDALKT